MPKHTARKKGKQGGSGRKAAAAARRKTRKKWTVLVWIAGDNDLDSFGLSDLREMKRVGSSASVDVVAQIDRAGSAPTVRYHLQKHTKLADDAVQSLGETNTGDPAVAVDFFSWGIRMYPSDRIMAVIWNHGNGIDETDIYKRAKDRGIRVYRRVKPAAAGAPRRRIRAIASSRFRRALFSTTVDSAIRTRAIAYDDESRDFLDNAELKRVLADVKKKTGRTIDVLGLDACLMNMVEVAYQLRDFVGHIVASEEVEPGDGWPYDRVLADLTARPDAAGADVAMAVVKRYLQSYAASDGVTDSAVDLSRVREMARTVDRLARACIAAIAGDAEYAAFSKALRATLRFDTRDFIDVGHFCSELSSRSASSEVKKACAAVREALSGARPFVIAEGHKGAALANATGTAIYFPTAGDAHLTYGRLDFAKDTHWGGLITKYQET